MQRDTLAQTIKSELDTAAFDNKHPHAHDAEDQTATCKSLIAQAQALAGS